MSAQVAADLRAAAEVLRRDGWTQGRYTDDDGCRCAEGAIFKAARWETRRIDPAREAVEAHLNHGLLAYNDHPSRTADEVIAALEAAADAAERQAAYDEGRWCGECEYGVVMDPPCCTQGPVKS